MPTKELILNYLSEHKKEFEERFNINRIGLFGSFAKGDVKADSDIDILIDFKENTTGIYNKKQELKLLLEKLFSTKVDIAREKYLKPLVKEEILKDVIYI